MTRSSSGRQLDQMPPFDLDYDDNCPECQQFYGRQPDAIIMASSQTVTRSGVGNQAMSASYSSERRSEERRSEERRTRQEISDQELLLTEEKHWQKQLLQ